MHVENSTVRHCARFKANEVARSEQSTAILKRRHRQLLVIFALTGSAMTELASPKVARADSVEEFYRGKTIDVVIGYSPGGTYDLYARIVTQFMGEHVPGKPHMVARNMIGAGSRIAANFVANIAPKDGTVLGTGDQAFAIEQAIGDKMVQFDAKKFNYIGSPTAQNNTTAVWAASGIKTIEDATKLEVPVAAGAGDPTSQIPMAMNATLGTKFKIILGYPGPVADVAMERGEVAGRGSNSWAAWKATHTDWLRDKKLNILVQIGLSKEPDLPDVPLLMDLAKNDLDRQALRLLSSPSRIGRPLFTSPGVPEERVKALREAFNATMKNPAFLAQAETLGVNPVSGEEIQKIVEDIFAAPQSVSDRLKEIIGVGEHK